MICASSYGFVSARLWKHVRDFNKSKFILSSCLSKIRCCSTINIHHPFKPDNKVRQPHTDESESAHSVSPLCIALPRHQHSNGDVIYTVNCTVGELPSVTTILKNSMSYSDHIRIQKWKEKARAQLGHLEYQKAFKSKTTDNRLNEVDDNNFNKSESIDDNLEMTDTDIGVDTVQDSSSSDQHYHTSSTSGSDGEVLQEYSINNANDIEQYSLQDDHHDSDTTADDDQILQKDNMNELDHDTDNWATDMEQNHTLTITRLQSLENELVEQNLPENMTTEQLELYDSIGKVELQKYVNLIRKRGHSIHEVRSSKFLLLYSNILSHLLFVGQA